RGGHCRHDCICLARLSHSSAKPKNPTKVLSARPWLTSCGLQLKFSEAERISNHRYGAKRHFSACEHWAEEDFEDRIEYSCCDWHAGNVVDEGEEQVLADISHRRLGESPRSNDSPKVSLEERYVCALDGDISSCSHGDSDACLGQCWRVVYSVAGHGDD